ncbi:MAG: adenylyltransferase/cytidyltransferase family protein [Patescibacteria group bacterium]|nr:adenylyltransferase/cytidyltransferase family protein [Patescibacteria group bacterium]
MVFGVFDGLHAGHEYFLRTAAARANELIVVVAPDEAVRALKGKPSRRSLEERMAAVAALSPHFLVVPGDAEAGSWGVLTAHEPDVVYLGYDQQPLVSELDTRGIPYEFIGAHEPGRYKSSLLDH